jgi:hypothetical protein
MGSTNPAREKSTKANIHLAFMALAAWLGALRYHKRTALETDKVGWMALTTFLLYQQIPLPGVRGR